MPINYDAIIVGAAGGGTLTRAPTGKRILILEPAIG
jgi:hypothetical protein